MKKCLIDIIAFDKKGVPYLKKEYPNVPIIVSGSNHISRPENYEPNKIIEVPRYDQFQRPLPPEKITMKKYYDRLDREYIKLQKDGMKRLKEHRETQKRTERWISRSKITFGYSSN